MDTNTPRDQRSSDAKLVRRSLAGEREAFSELVDRHRRAVYALSVQRVQNSSDADDVAQESFIRAYRSLHTLREPEKFGSWLYGIAMRAGMDCLRTRGKRSERSDPLGLHTPPSEDNTELKELVDVVMVAVGELSDAHRLVVTLRYLEGLSAKEIALRLGESRVAIRSRLFKAMQILRRRLASLITTE